MRLVVLACFLLLVVAATTALGAVSVVDDGVAALLDDEDAHRRKQWTVLMEVAKALEAELPLLDTKQVLASADPIKCDLCNLVTTDLWMTIQNGGKPLDKLEEVVNATCHKVVKDAKDAALCGSIGDLLLYGLHRFLKGDESLHFNFTMILCADVLKVCKVDCCVSKHLPEQVHISYTGGDAVGASTMQATWVSATKTTGPVVQWWPTAAGRNANASKTAGGESRTYTVAGWVGWIHGAVMTGLQPDTEYTYTVGSDDAGFSPEFSFRTLPLNVGTSERPLRVATFADMGVGGDHKQTITQLESLVANGELDLIVHTGDISYADGDQYRWDRFMRQMEPIVSRIPYMTTPGNHEALWNFTAYKQRFFTPPAGHGAPTDAMYYTFSVGQFRFLMMDSETWWDTPRMDPVQVAWADRVLTEANQMKQFIYVGFHRPLYCTTPCGLDCAEYSAYLRAHFEDLAVAKGVSIIHTGHVHNYERMLPTFNSTVMATNYSDLKYPVNYVDGAAGCTEGLEHFGHVPNRPKFSAERLVTTGFLRLTLHSDPTWHHCAADFVASKDLSVLDGINITRRV